MGLMDKESRDLEMRERFRPRCTRFAKPCAVDSIYKGCKIFQSCCRLSSQAIMGLCSLIGKAVAPRR